MATQTKFQTAYGPKKRPTIVCPPGMTEQSHREECDINQILAKYVKTGNIDFGNKYEPQYGDQTSLDFHEAMNIVTSANSMFEELPAKTRNKFKNDPALFLDFVQDEKNHEEMFELGLTTTPPPEKPKPESPPTPDPEDTPPET